MTEQLESADSALAEETSLAYLGQWNRLVSTTNWEKGRIILEWREALVAADAPPPQYSDEAWSRRVGNVSGQHVGRLRRVFERFGGTRGDYPTLYWSHFQAALDWDDAEMWLEGAVQSRWSVSQMRMQRWEAIGAPAELKPRESDIITGEIDEDYSEPNAGAQQVRDPGDGSADYGQGPDFGDEAGAEVQAGVPFDVDAADYPAEAATDPVRPFENLPELPPDLTDAFESFKLAILHHKLADWREVARDDVLAALDALKRLALAAA